MCSKESIGKGSLFSYSSLFRVFMAATYVKLQQAYISEAVATGTWTVIGYKGPGDQTTAGTATGGSVSKTNNFQYSDATGFTDNSAALSTNKVGFTATNLAKLNDCAISSTWTMTVGEGSAAGEATFTPNVLTADCVQLTPNWKQIGK